MIRTELFSRLRDLRSNGSRALPTREFLSSLILSVKIACVSVVIACVLGTMVSLWSGSPAAGKRILRHFYRQSSFRLSSAPLYFCSTLPFSEICSRILEVVPDLCDHRNFLCHQNRHGQSGGTCGFEEASLVLSASPVRTLFKVAAHVSARESSAEPFSPCRRAFDECVIIMFMKSAKTVTFPLRLYS